MTSNDAKTPAESFLEGTQQNIDEFDSALLIIIEYDEYELSLSQLISGLFLCFDLLLFACGIREYAPRLWAASMMAHSTFEDH